MSTQGQTLDRQIAALRAEGVDKIFREKASAASLRNRPELEKTIDSLGTGDTLVLAEWDRCTRSMDDGLKIITRIAERGAMVKVLDRQYLDLTTPLGRGLLALLSSLAEDERMRINKRANEGRTLAKERGVTFGRKPKLTEHQRQVALERLAAGEGQRAIAKDLNVAQSTISRLSK